MNSLYSFLYFSSSDMFIHKYDPNYDSVDLLLSSQFRLVYISAIQRIGNSYSSYNNPTYLISFSYSSAHEFYHKFHSTLLPTSINYEIEILDYDGRDRA